VVPAAVPCACEDTEPNVPRTAVTLNEIPARLRKFAAQLTRVRSFRESRGLQATKMTKEGQPLRRR
jgi:hypothetical protein